MIDGAVLKIAVDLARLGASRTASVEDEANVLRLVRNTFLQRTEEVPRQELGKNPWKIIGRRRFGTFSLWAFGQIPRYVTRKLIIACAGKEIGISIG